MKTQLAVDAGSEPAPALIPAPDTDTDTAGQHAQEKEGQP